MASPDLRELPRDDMGVLAAGALAFILSLFVPYYGASVSAGAFHGSASTSAWHSYSTLALLLVIVATVIVAVQVFAAASLPQIAVSWNMVALGLSALGTLLFIIRAFTLDHGSVGGFSYGLKWGAYVLMVILVAHTVFSYLRVRAAGEAMPWAHGGASPHPPAA